MSLGPYDYGILGFYLLFVLSIGLAFRRLSKSSGDYFRAGRAMRWWITGTSAWIASFTVVAVAGGIWATRPLLIDREWPDVRLAVNTRGAVLAMSAWFFGTTLFYPRVAGSTADLVRIERIFQTLATPVHADTEARVDYDGVLYRMMGVLFMVVGSFVTLLCLIPNGLTGRLCFVFRGGSILLTGMLLYALPRWAEAHGRRRALGGGPSTQSGPCPALVGSAEVGGR